MKRNKNGDMSWAKLRPRRTTGDFPAATFGTSEPRKRGFINCVPLIACSHSPTSKVPTATGWANGIT